MEVGLIYVRDLPEVPDMLYDRGLRIRYETPEQPEFSLLDTSHVQPQQAAFVDTP